MNSANRDFSKAIMEKGKDMRFKNFLIVVNDIERSRNCDHEVSLNNAMNPPIKNAPPYAQGVRLYLISVATHNKKCRNVNENADIPTFFLVLSSKNTIRHNPSKYGQIWRAWVSKRCQKSLPEIRQAPLVTSCPQAPGTAPEPGAHSRRLRSASYAAVRRPCAPFRRLWHSHGNCHDS